MSPLLLICDPTYQYSRVSRDAWAPPRDRLAARPDGRRTAWNAIRLFTPDFVLIACETDSNT